MSSNAQFVSFSCTHDLDNLPAGTEFTCTWRFKNVGTTTWKTGFKAVHIHEETGSTLMASQASFDLPTIASRSTVAPNQDVKVVIKMTAPNLPDRRYFTDWQLQDPQGNLFGDVFWLRLVTVKPPVDTSGNFRSSGLTFVEDHSIPDNTPIRSGETFRKQWAVKNTGQRKWGDGYRIVFVGGDKGMSGTYSFPVPEANTNEEVLISIDMVAPQARAEPYVSSWRVYDDRNIPFGDTLWVKIYATSDEEFNINPYSQNDGKWKHHKLGFGPRTFGEFGCLLTCFTMMLSGFQEYMTPLELNNRLLKMPAGRGFDGSDVYFAAPQNMFSHVRYLGNYMPRANTGAKFAQVDPNLIGRIDRALDNGQGVIFQVDTDPNSPYNFGVEQHWVFALARQGNDYLVLDPFVGEPISLLGRYGQQSKPQNPTEALKDAIKSAIFYSSGQSAMDLGVEPEAVVDGASSSMSGEKPKSDLAYTGPAWKFNKCLIGLHDRANRHPLPADHAIARGKFESIKVQSGVTVEEMKGYQADFYMCRLFESWNGRHLPVDQFIRAVVPDMQRLVDAGVEYFELHNEPNLTHEGLKAHGVEGSWRNGAEFAQYFIEARNLLKRRYPNIKVGFPGLSPGGDTAYQFGHDSGFRMGHKAFLEQAQGAVQQADFVCVHTYYGSFDELRTSTIDEIKYYRRMFPDKLIFVSEFSNPRADVSYEDKGKQAKEFYRLCNEIPGVGAAYYFIVSGSGWDNQAIRRDADGGSTGMIEHMF